LFYNDDTPQEVFSGLPQHETIKKGTYRYYYSIISEDKAENLEAVLKVYSPKVQLFASFERDVVSKSPSQWTKPTLENHQFTAKAILGQKMLTLDEEHLASCFNAQAKKEGKECGVIFGIYADESGPDEATYSFVVYSNMLTMHNNMPVVGRVAQREFNYYLYEADCDNCTLLISLATFSNGDPDLYIVKGDGRLPSKKEYDIMSSTWKSEVVEISSEHPYFKHHPQETVKGTYVIGVYGSTNSSYTLSVSQENTPMVVMVDGQPVKSTQNGYDIKYYRFYNWAIDKNVLINLQVQTGAVDVYVSTYDEASGEEDLV